MKNSVAILKKRLLKKPNDVNLLGPLAEEYRNQGNSTSAIDIYKKILALEPNNYQVLNNYGTLLRNQGEVDLSLKVLNQANELLPDHPIILTNLANTYNSLGRYDLAKKACNRAIVKQPDFFDAHEMYGNTLLFGGDYKDAVISYERALKLKPDNDGIIISLARTWHFLNEDQKAYDLIAPLIKNKVPDCANLFFSVSKRLNKQKEAVAYINEVIKTNKNISNEALSSLKFSLAKYYDKQSEYKLAIENFHQANKLSNYVFDGNLISKQFNDIINAFTEKTLNEMPATNNNSKSPIFILGMPRSGTSLIEQILASHPDVFGAGELNNIDIAIKEARFRKGNTKIFPHSITSLNSKEINSIADKYLKFTKNLSANNIVRVTDKMPHNFMHIGIILKLFPSAYIIHCRRHPLDTCLSCYFSEFGTAGHGYSYSLKGLGKYYLEYDRMMNHWLTLFGNKIFQVKYEDVIDNHESTCRELVSYCDLEWNDACLEFHKNKRQTHTLSYDQVNKPIYKGSMKRWENYSDHIGALEKMLNAIIKAY